MCLGDAISLFLSHALSLTKPWTWRGADVDNSGAITREEFVTWVAAGSGLAEFLSQSLLMFLNPRSSRR